MKNKKSMTLSINFLVIMIIMVVLFGFGIYLFTTVFNETTKMDQDIHNKERDRLNMLMDDGALVTVLDPQQNSDKDPLRFPIGITNENSEGDSNNFKIVIDSCKFTSDDGTHNDNDCKDSDVYQIALDASSGFDIKNNERVFRLLLVIPQDQGGFYSIVLHVERKEGTQLDWKDYGKNQMIWVTVP